MYGAKPNNVIVSTGSGAILTAAVMAYCNSERALVSGDPSYGSPAGTAQRIKAPVKLIPVDSKLALDFEGMIRASIGAGLVFLCNPNNPTSSVREHGGRRADRAHHQAAVAGNRHPDRRGVSRVRDGAGIGHDGEARSRIAGRVHLAHVLQGLRHGRHAHGLRHWPARDDEQGRTRLGPRRHQRAAGGGRHRGAERHGAHGVGAPGEQACPRLDAGRSSGRWASRRPSRRPTSSS